MAGTYGKAQKEVPTFSQFGDTFLERYAAVHNKASERSSKRKAIKTYLAATFNAKRLDEITSADFAAFAAAQREKGLSPKTVNNRLLVLHRMLVVAKEWGHEIAVPTLKLLRVPKASFDFLTFEEAERLVEAAGRSPLPWLRPAVVVALNTGLRVGEVLALRWADVDLKAGRMVVKHSDYYGEEDDPKSNRWREIPLNTKAREALKAHRHLRSDRVFCHDDGERLRYRQVQTPLDHVCELAGLRRVTWHVLRHSFASHLVMRGVVLKSVQELMGHGDLATTMRYAHLAPGYTDAAVAALEAPAGQQPVNEVLVK
jgi:integrase